MNFLNYKDAIGVGIFMSFMIGPVFFMLLKTSILKGIKAALAFDVGVILGDIFFICLAYFGSKNLLEKIKEDPRLFLIGGVVLIVYGLITYLDKNNKKEGEPEVEAAKGKNYLKLLLNGFFLNFINIGVLAGWLGIMVVVGPTLKMNPTAIFWYFAVVIASYLGTDIIKIILAKQLRKKLTPLVIYRIKRGMGILLIVFGVFFMLKNFIPDDLIPQDKIDQIMDKVERKR